MSGLRLPTATTGPSSSGNRFVYTVRPGRVPRSEQEQPIEEPLVIPEMDLTARIENCHRRIFGFTSRGQSAPWSMEKELENLLQGAESVKAP